MTSIRRVDYRLRAGNGVTPAPRTPTLLPSRPMLPITNWTEHGLKFSSGSSNNGQVFSSMYSRLEEDEECLNICPRKSTLVARCPMA